jgi:hypothetical protein
MQALKRSCAAAVALIGLFALALQLDLMLGYAAASGETALWGVLRFFSFFTVLTNTIAVIVLTATALNARNFLARPSAQTALLVYIIIVCVIYTALLRNLWDPNGAQELADDLLHYVMPALYLIFWLLFVPKHELRLRDAFSWLIYPGLYVAAILWRGAMIGQYPYPFLDAGKLGYGHIALNIVGLGAIFLGLGLAAIWVGMRAAKKLRQGP